MWFAMQPVAFVVVLAIWLAVPCLHSPDFGVERTLELFHCSTLAASGQLGFLATAQLELRRTTLQWFILCSSWDDIAHELLESRSNFDREDVLQALFQITLDHSNCRIVQHCISDGYQRHLLRDIECPDTTDAAECLKKAASGR